MKYLVSLFFILITLSFFACKENNTVTAEQLVGRWEIQEATRNDRPTESLAELYFEFTADGKLRTNFTGTPEEGTYELKGNQLLQRNTQMNADYTIEKIEVDKLVLTTTLRDYAFRFCSKKQRIRI